MGRHHQKPAPTTVRAPGRKPSPHPRTQLLETIQDYATWPMITLALAIMLVLGVLVGVLIS